MLWILCHWKMNENQRYGAEIDVPRCWSSKIHRMTNNKRTHRKPSNGTKVQHCCITAGKWVRQPKNSESYCDGSHQSASILKTQHFRLRTVISSWTFGSACRLTNSTHVVPLREICFGINWMEWHDGKMWTVASLEWCECIVTFYALVCIVSSEYIVAWFDTLLGHKCLCDTFARTKGVGLYSFCLQQYFWSMSKQSQSPCLLVPPKMSLQRLKNRNEIVACSMLIFKFFLFNFQ